MKDLEREVELLREKVRLLERLRELEGGSVPVPYYPIPPYIPADPLPWNPPYVPWTYGDHTGTWWPDPNTIISVYGGDITADGSGAVTTEAVANYDTQNVTWTQ